jgi:hypothetical protein
LRSMHGQYIVPQHQPWGRVARSRVASDTPSPPAALASPAEGYANNGLTCRSCRRPAVADGVCTYCGKQWDDDS